MQGDIDNCYVIPSLKSDLSTIVLSINGIENRSRGPSFWKLNQSLLDDKEYGFTGMTTDRTRQERMYCSKLKRPQKRRSKKTALESKLNDCQKIV